MKRLDVCILGAGIVGKTTAMLLAKQGLRVGLVGAERRKDGSVTSDIRAYAINQQSRELLQELKVWPQDAACAVEHMHVFGDGEGAIQFDAPSHTAPLAHIVDATALEARLDQALEYQSDLHLIDSDTLHANTEQTPLRAELTVICEGGRSSSRSALPIAYENHPYTQTALAGWVDYADGNPNTAYQWFDNGSILALLPRNATEQHATAEDTPDAPQYALVWSVSPAQAQELSDLPAEAVADRIAQVIRESTPSDSTATTHDDQAGDLSEAEDTTNTHAATHGIRVQSPLAQWPLRLAQATRWCGRYADRATDSSLPIQSTSWVLAGDAAHTMHPLAGQGLNCGLADAACLARTLAEREYFRSVADLRLLRRYERAQKAHWQELRQATDGLQRLFSHDDTRVHVLRNWGMSQVNRLSPVKNWLMQRARGVQNRSAQS